MTIESILELSASQLEKMTDEELKKAFAPYLPTIRKPLSNEMVAKAQALLKANEDNRHEAIIARAKKLLG